MGSPFTVTAILAAYNEGDIIGAVVEDLIAQGLKVYLLDHQSTDDTVAEASRFLGRGLLGIEHFPEESGLSVADAKKFHWLQILMRKEQLASELESDWFVHTDADELRESPLGGQTLCEGIETVDQLGYNAIDFAVYNFPPVDNSYRRGADLRAAFPLARPAAEFDRLQVKCWKKQPAGVYLNGSGGHEAEFPGRKIFPLRFLVRHYPIRSQAHGERKVYVERRPRFVDEERKLGWHVQYDQIAPGHSFIEDPATLTRFDPPRVRMELAMRHRGVETLAAVRGEREQLLAERDALSSELGDAVSERAALRGELARATGELGRARQDRDELERLGARLRDLEGQLDALHASRTWRWSSAARLAWRALGRR